MDNEILTLIILNGMLIISFSSLASRVRQINSGFKYKFFRLMYPSLITSVLSIFCMGFPILKTPDISYDFANIPVAIIASVFGIPQALIAGLVAAAFRVYKEGIFIYQNFIFSAIVPVLIGGIYYSFKKIINKNYLQTVNLKPFNMVILAFALWMSNLILLKFISFESRVMLQPILIYLLIAYILIFVVTGFIAGDNIVLFQRQCRLKDETMTDELTGLKNYRYIVNHIYGVLTDIKSSYKQLSVLMIDIDKFKRYNDTFGHAEGNKVLKGVSDILLESVRRGDIVTRYGGEEFLILLQHTGIKEAHRIAERIRKNVQKMKYEIESSNTRLTSVTVSIGISEYPIHGDDIHDLINKADIALYKAKELGRNNVQVYRPPDREEMDYKVAHVGYE